MKRLKRLWCRLRDHNAYWIEHTDDGVKWRCMACLAKHPFVALDYPPPRVRFSGIKDHVRLVPDTRRG